MAGRTRLACDGCRHLADRAGPGRRRCSVRNLLERIDFQRHDLPDTFPEGLFDLVSAQFLHSTVELDRPQSAAPGRGRRFWRRALLIVDHGGPPPWASKLDHHHEFPSADEVVDSLNLDAGEWERVRLEAVDREATGPDGEVATWTDNVIVLRRHQTR